MGKVSSREPIISIIVPVYNGEQFIKESIENLLKIKSQKEIIVINDCSNDKSLEILKKYKDSIVLIDLKENKGVSNARNLGIKTAKGKYIGFVDIDDSIDYNMFDEMIKVIEKEQADVCVCNYDEIYENSDVVVRSKYVLPIKSTTQDKTISLYLTDQISPAIWDKIYTRNLLEKIQFKNGLAVGEDILFCLNIFLQAKKTCYIDKAFYHYLQQNNSVMHKLSPKLLQFKEVAKSIDPQKREKLINKYKEEFEYFELEMITRGIHSISMLCNKITKQEAQEYLKVYFDKKYFERILKSKYYSKSIKLEIFLLKTFGIRFHLFLMPIYKFIRNKIR